MRKNPQHENLSIKLGNWFEASANGKFAIIALILLVIGILVAKVLGIF